MRKKSNTLPKMSIYVPALVITVYDNDNNVLESKVSNQATLVMSVASYELFSMDSSITDSLLRTVHMSCQPTPEAMTIRFSGSVDDKAIHQKILDLTTATHFNFGSFKKKLAHMRRINFTVAMTPDEKRKMIPLVMIIKCCL